MTRPTGFAALHSAAGPFLLLNCWDVASPVLLADAGFPAVGTTSLGITAAAWAARRAGAGRDLTVALAAALARRLPVPLTVDLEGGYSNDPEQVAELAARLAELGVSNHPRLSDLAALALVATSVGAAAEHAVAARGQAWPSWEPPVSPGSAPARRCNATP